MTQNDLLPQNATDLERAFSLATSPAARLDPPVTAMRGIKFIGTPPSWLPFLIYEYGLGELSPYVPSLFQLIMEGVKWQRIRGTPGAIMKGLGWLGYGAGIEEAPIRRTRWHLFQLAMNRLRDNEEPDLERIEAVTQLSVPLRSHFWRGFRTYDVRAAEYGWKRWGNSIWSDCSGVRIRDGGAKWSFGRVYDHDHEMTQAELTALGVWEPTVGNAPRTWASLNVPWPNTPWAEISVEARRNNIIGGLAPRTAWATFLDSSGAVIGHRRARCWQRVVADGASAHYQVGTAPLDVAGASATGLYFEAMTDFGDGFGQTAAKWQIRLGATLVDASRPGLLWAEPGELTGGIVAAEKTETIEFGRTVRERCRALLRVV